MGILAKVSPSVANSDVLLYKCPEGQQAGVVVSAVNTSASSQTVRLAGLKGADLSIASATVVTGGSGFSSMPNLVAAGKNTSSALVLVSAMFVTALSVNTNGSGYTSGDVLTLVGGSGTPATVRVATTAANGGITSVAVLTGGRYTALVATASPAAVTGGTGAGAKLDTIRYGVKELFVSDGGNGYETTPTLTATQDGATGFTATVEMTQKVERIDYFEYDQVLDPSGVLERSFLLGPSDTLFCSANAASVVNFSVLGLVEIA